MITSLLIALVTVILLGSGAADQNYFYVTSIAQQYEKVVVSKVDQNAIQEILNGYHAEGKEFHNGVEVHARQWLNLLESQQSNSQEFKDWEKEQIRLLTIGQQKVLDVRMQCLKHITAEEWEQILLESEKDRAKDTEKLKKRIAKINVTDLRKEIEKSSMSAGYKNQAQTHIDIMESSFLKLANLFAYPPKANQQLIDNYHSTATNFEKVSQEIYDLRLAVFNNVVNFHLFTAKQMEPKEWERLSNKMVDLMKK